MLHNSLTVLFNHKRHLQSASLSSADTGGSSDVNICTF